jgi:hypothetical protein
VGRNFTNGKFNDAEIDGSVIPNQGFAAKQNRHALRVPSNFDFGAIYSLSTIP